MTNEPALNDYQRIINVWILSHGGYWPPLSMLGALMEELGELARILNGLEGFKPKKEKEDMGNIGDELADILYALICIANFYNIDLAKELDKSIKKISNRDSNRFVG